MALTCNSCHLDSISSVVAEDSSNLSFIVQDKQFNIQTKGPSLCVVNNTLIQISSNDSEDQQLVYDVFAIEPDGSFNVISLGNDLFVQSQSADVAVHEASNTLIEVHSDNNHDLNYRLGTLNGGIIEWKTSDAIIYASGGEDPSLAVAPTGLVISVHRGFESNKLFYNLGRLAQNATKIEWIAPVIYNADPSTSPIVYIVENNTVIIETHIEKNQMYYNIGKLSGTDFNEMTIEWLNDQWISYKTCNGECGNVDLMVDPFGIIMVSHSEINQNIILKNIQLFYITGVLKNSSRSIQWSNSGDVRYSNSAFGKTSIAFLRDYNHIYIESHDSSDSSGLKMSTLAFGVELVHIEYKPYIKGDSIAFAIQETHFNNNGPVTLEQTWVLEEQYSCTNTYHWELKFHVGISVTASVKFLGSGVSTTESVSLGLSVGHSSSMSSIFTWTETNTITIPPTSGNVSYIATIYRDLHSVPFIATFKRGATTWTETGTVEVSHGAIYSHIVSGNTNNINN